MSNIESRHQTRKKMIETLNLTSNGKICFEIKTAVMQTEILDEYLLEKIRSDKVIEGLLQDIYAAINDPAIYE